MKSENGEIAVPSLKDKRFPPNRLKPRAASPRPAYFQNPKSICQKEKPSGDFFMCVPKDPRKEIFTPSQARSGSSRIHRPYFPPTFRIQCVTPR